MITLAEIQTFIELTHSLSFTNAAVKMGSSPSQLSKNIKSLEDRLKVKLFMRNTRKVALTKEGQLFLKNADRVMEALLSLENTFLSANNPETLMGEILLTAPHTLGNRFLTEPLSQFAKKYPKVHVLVELDNKYLDMITNKIDFAIRIMDPKDSSLVARRLADNPVAIYGSPQYLKRHKVIKTIKDLKNHFLFCITPHLDFHFSDSKKQLRNFTSHTPISCEDGDFLVELALQDLGLVVRSEWGVQKKVAKGTLVKVDLDEHIVSKTAIYLVYGKNDFAPIHKKIFLKFLMDYYKIKKIGDSQ